MTKPSGTAMSLVVRLVLSLKIIIDGKINPSAATVRMTVTCLFGTWRISYEAFITGRNRSYYQERNFLYC